MKNENLVPKVRFKGFSDPWEQRKLSEIGKIQGGGTPDSGKPEYWNGTINWFTPTEVSNNGFLENSIRKITNLGLKKSSATLLPPKTVLITSRAGVGNMGILKYPASTNQGFQSFIPDSNTDEYFIYSMQPFISRIANRWASGSTFTEISGKQMAKIEIGIPDTSEQKKISELMKIIDNLIAANEDKLEQLKTLKKLLMQKIFSQEWRFKGFTDPWEQRKLLEVAKRLSKTSNKKELPRVEYADIISGSGKLNKNFSRQHLNDDRVGIQFFAENVLYGKLRPYLNNWLFPNFNGIAIGDFWVFQVRKNNAASFLYALIQSPQYQQISNISTGTKMPRSDWKKVSAISFDIPSTFEEQQMIGNYFLVLDDLIAANEDKLQQLKELKKYLMQNMFV